MLGSKIGTAPLGNRGRDVNFNPIQIGAYNRNSQR